MAATALASDGPLLLVDYLLRFARIAIVLSLWRLLFEGQAEVAGVALAQVLTYSLIAEVFHEQLAPHAGIDEAMWNGSIATRSLRPGAIVGHFAAEMGGRWWLGLIVVSLPLLGLAPLLGVDPRPAGWQAGLLFLPSLVLAIAVSLAIEFVFAGLTMMLNQNPWIMESLKNAIAAVLSGILVPLPLLPWGLGSVVAWLPFAATAASPLQVYTGVGDPSVLVLSQLAWAVALWLSARWIWERNREKVTVFGG
jgi:ABC-2 type transport system permease protein